MPESGLFVSVTADDAIATVAISRGKVNALNLAVVDQLHQILTELETDDRVRTIILTGRGPFFSFGFDIPEMFPLSRDEFADFLVRFTTLYRTIFTYPKPMLAALNGHTIAGGCMLALACDQRLMIGGKARIALNEITFGSSVFAGAVEMLRFATGSRNATAILQSGALLSAAEAHDRGLIDAAIAPEAFDDSVREAAKMLAEKPLPAFRSIKRLLRQPIAEEFAARERASIAEFVDIWYSPPTREQLQKITIRV